MRLIHRGFLLLLGFLAKAKSSRLDYTFHPAKDCALMVATERRKWLALALLSRVAFMVVRKSRDRERRVALDQGRPRVRPENLQWVTAPTPSSSACSCSWACAHVRRLVRLRLSSRHRPVHVSPRCSRACLVVTFAYRGAFIPGAPRQCLPAALSSSLRLHGGPCRILAPRLGRGRRLRASSAVRPGGGVLN